MRVGVNGSLLPTGLLPAPWALLRIFPRRAPLLGLVLLGLAGCSTLQGDEGGGIATSGGQPVLAQPADPLSAFAARARPGQEEVVGSPPVRARMMRAYNSGGGRPCREIMLGSASTGNKALYCEATPGVWTSVRPLLGTGQVAARP
jgi:hypothetical protein